MKLELVAVAAGSWVRARIVEGLSAKLLSATVIGWVPGVVEEVTVSLATPLPSVSSNGWAGEAPWPEKVTTSLATGLPAPSTTWAVATVVLVPLAAIRDWDSEARPK